MGRFRFFSLLWYTNPADPGETSSGQSAEEASSPAPTTDQNPPKCEQTNSEPQPFYSIGRVDYHAPFPDLSLTDDIPDALRSIYPATPGSIIKKFKKEEAVARWGEFSTDAERGKIEALEAFSAATDDQKSEVSDEIAFEALQAVRLLEHIFDAQDDKVNGKAQFYLSNLGNEILQFLLYQCCHGERKKEAFSVLLALAKGANQALNRVAGENEELAREFARSEYWWPTMVGQRAKDWERVKEMHDRLKLASNLKKTKKGKREFDLEAVSTRRAAQLISYMGRIRAVTLIRPSTEVFPNLPSDLLKRIRELPDFEEGTAADKWFRASWRLLKNATQGKPEDRSDLHHLGKDRVRRLADQEKKKEQEIPLKRRNQEIRIGIKNALKQAFRSLSKSLLPQALLPNPHNINFIDELK